MKKATGLDRALLHGLHLRLYAKSEPISPAALRAVVRVAQAYTQGIRDDRKRGSEVNEEYYQDSLALLEVLTLALLQSRALTEAQDSEDDEDGRRRKSK